MLALNCHRTSIVLAWFLLACAVPSFASQHDSPVPPTGTISPLGFCWEFHLEENITYAYFGYNNTDTVPHNITIDSSTNNFTISIQYSNFTLSPPMFNSSTHPLYTFTPGLHAFSAFITLDHNLTQPETFPPPDQEYLFSWNLDGETNSLNTSDLNYACPANTSVTLNLLFAGDPLSDAASAVASYLSEILLITNNRLEVSLENDTSQASTTQRSLWVRAAASNDFILVVQITDGAPSSFYLAAHFNYLTQNDPSVISELNSLTGGEYQGDVVNSPILPTPPIIGPVGFKSPHLGKSASAVIGVTIICAAGVIAFVIFTKIFSTNSVPKEVDENAPPLLRNDELRP